MNRTETLEAAAHRARERDVTRADIQRVRQLFAVCHCGLARCRLCSTWSLLFDLTCHPGVRGSK